MKRTTRRDLLGWAGAGAALSLLNGCRAPAAAPVSSTGDADFTFAVLNDAHTFAEKGAAEGLARAVEHAMGQSRAPEGILAGGDMAMDILATGKDEADAQYDLFDEATRGARVPIHPVVGNHDCLGVYEEGGVDPADPLYGKGYFRQRFGRDPYYSFDHEGWHFVVLDTVGIDPDSHSYRGWVDAEQIAWLDDDLSATARPTVVLGHIPLFSNFIEWQRGTGEGIPAGVSVVNSHEVASVLVRHPVKLVVAGHLHINETFLYKGIEFANVGAVSGNWWDGTRDGFEEGYGMLEFRGDQVSWRYVDYGWEARGTPDRPA